MTKDAFLNRLRELHIEGWKSKYINPDNFAELEKLFGITE